MNLKSPIDFDDPNWRTILNKQLHELLTILDRAKREGGEGWVSSAKLPNIPYHTRQIASVKGCIEGRGTTKKREYRILPAGQQALADGKAPDPERQREVSGLDIEAAPEPNYDAALTVVPPGAPPLLPGLNVQLHTNGNGGAKRFISSPAVEAVQKNAQAAVGAMPLPPYAHACVRVVEILAEDFPEVGDLVEMLMKLQSRKGSARE